MRPVPTENEIRWLLKEAAKYLSPELLVRRQDVLSAWCGIRPLVNNNFFANTSSDSSNTSQASRDHMLYIEPSQPRIVYVLGGKWTTYRQMSADVVDKIISLGLVSTVNSNMIYPKCRTLERSLIGYEGI